MVRARQGDERGHCIGRWRRGAFEGGAPRADAPADTIDSSEHVTGSREEGYQADMFNFGMVDAAAAVCVGRFVECEIREARPVMSITRLVGGGYTGHARK